MLERTRLSARRNHIAADLPHGDQRKLEIAMLIALEPQVFMFDEPTAGMSVDDVPVVLDLIREIKTDRSKTILLVEHKMDVVRELADRIVVLHNGRLMADGEPPKSSPRPSCNRPTWAWPRRRRRHERDSARRGAAPGTNTPAGETRPLLELKDVHTHIGAYHILHGVDLTVPAGQVTMLLGRNGAGKTTTLRTIMGLWKASQGNVRFDGEAAGGRRARVTARHGAPRRRLRAREHGHLRRPVGEGEHPAGARGAANASQLDTARLEWIFGFFPRCASSGCIRPASFPAGRSRCWRSRVPSSNRAGCC